MGEWVSELSPAEITVFVVALISISSLVWTVILFRKMSSNSDVLINGNLDAELERELFKRLWSWLSIIGAIVSAITVGAWVIISAGFAGEARDTASREAQAAVENQLRKARDAFERQERTIAKLQADTDQILNDATRDRVEIAQIVAAAKERALAAEDAAKAAALELDGARRLRAADKSLGVPSEKLDLASIAESLAKNTEFQDAVAASALGPLTGIVVASTRRCAELPGGWADYEEGAGKFLIGAGRGELRYRGPHRPGDAGNVTSLTPVSVGDQGGAERHRLSVKEMPRHRHFAPPGYVHWWYRIGGNADHRITDEHREGGPIPLGYAQVGGSLELTEEGSDQPHNNMPPYIALYFCKKEG